MRNRMGEPETGVPTRYCLTSTQDPKPQFYAAANYGWFSSADQPLTWTANSPLAGPLRPFFAPEFQRVGSGVRYSDFIQPKSPRNIRLHSKMGRRGEENSSTDLG